MTKKEKQNTQKARNLILTVRNFLTDRRNKEPNADRQKEYNDAIDALLAVLDLTKPER